MCNGDGGRWDGAGEGGYSDGEKRRRIRFMLLVMVEAGMMPGMEKLTSMVVV